MFFVVNFHTKLWTLTRNESGSILARSHTKKKFYNFGYFFDIMTFWIPPANKCKTKAELPFGVPALSPLFATKTKTFFRSAIGVVGLVNVCVSYSKRS